MTALSFLILLAALFVWNELPRPYARPPARTQVEQVAVDRAVKEVGNYTIKDTPEGIYLDMREKGKHWIVRRPHAPKI